VNDEIHSEVLIDAGHGTMEAQEIQTKLIMQGSGKIYTIP